MRITNLAFYPQFGAPIAFSWVFESYPHLRDTFINQILKFEEHIFSQSEVNLKNVKKVEKVLKTQCLI